MRKGASKKLLVLVAPLFLNAPACWARTKPLKAEVKVVGKQESTKESSYVVPGYTYSTYQSNPAWTGQGLTGYGVKTSGAATNIPAQEHSYTVRGAVLSLELPDGRIAVVNCASKINWTGIRPIRSCRIPPDDVTVLKAEFDGTDAILFWKWQEKKLVSLNDTKTVTHKETETYKLIDVLVPATPPKKNP